MSVKLSAEAHREEKFIKMTTQPVEGLILKLAIPTILSMLVTTFYNMADTYFVGKIGLQLGAAEQAIAQTRATAAVGIALPLMAIIQAFGFFFGHGSGNCVSRLLGKKDVQSAQRVASSGFFYAIITGLIILILGQVFAYPMAQVFGATKDGSAGYAVQYMRIILCGAPITMASLVLNNQMRFQGNAAYAMLGIMSGAVLNIGLDALFILVLGMEVFGAALATVIGQIVSLALLFIGTERSDCLKIRPRCVCFDKATVRDIVKGGLPSLGRQGLASISTACLNNMAGMYGALEFSAVAGVGMSDALAETIAADSAVAAMSVVSKIMMFASSTLIGFGQGFQPVCGFNYGAGLYDRVKKAFWFCAKVSFFFLLAVAVLAFIFAGDIMALFRANDKIALDIGTTAMRMQIVTFPLMSWVVMSNMMLQTVGRVVSATVLAVSRQGLMFIPVVLTLPLVIGLTGVQMSQLIADLLSFAVAVPITLRFLKELNDSATENMKKKTD